MSVNNERVWPMKLTNPLVVLDLESTGVWIEKDRFRGWACSDLFDEVRERNLEGR